VDDTAVDDTVAAANAYCLLLLLAAATAFCCRSSHLRRDGHSVNSGRKNTRRPPI